MLEQQVLKQPDEVLAQVLEQQVLKQPDEVLAQVLEQCFWHDFSKLKAHRRCCRRQNFCACGQKLGQVCLNGSILSLPVCQPGLHAFDLALLMVNGVRFVRERHTVIAVLTPWLSKVLAQ